MAWLIWEAISVWFIGVGLLAATLDPEFAFDTLDCIDGSDLAIKIIRITTMTARTKVMACLVFLCGFVFVFGL
jgi:hypothetical protein